MDPEQLAREVVDLRARRNPSWATQVGIRGHDARLKETSPAAMLAYADEVEALLARAQALPPSIDRDALVTTLGVQLFELREARRWARDPDLAADYFDHILSVFLVAHLSDDEKLAAIAGRLEGAARFFHDGWTRYDPGAVPRAWVEGALDSVEAAPAFLDAVRHFAAGRSGSARIEAALRELERTLEAHRDWLRALHERAQGATALGEEKLRRLLHVRRIPESPEELLALGERTRARFREELEDAALTVLAEAGKSPGGDAVAEANALVRADHPPTFAEVLREYRASIDDARAFVVSRRIATPTEIPLAVMETPSFLRHLIPFAAYQMPARFATPRRGVYLVTPKMDLTAFHRADTRNTTVHEAWPGHHLQLAVAAERASTAAWLADAIEYAEGWALYCETMMGAHGFANAPADRFVRARDALWRAWRITLDVGLHTGRLGLEDAAATLQRETGMSAEEAHAEALRYTLEPAYNLSYMYGRLKIEALRERFLAAGGTERGFHDAVLAAGPLPIALLERALARATDIRQA